MSKSNLPQRKNSGTRRSNNLAKTIVTSTSVNRPDTASVALSTRLNIPRPQISSLQRRGDAAIRVRHNEFIMDIQGSSGFSTDFLPINPGVNITFPWLATIANNFESYRFSSLKFVLLTSSATTSVGRIIMAVDYDASDAAPVNKSQLMTYHGAVAAAPWQNLEFVCDKADLGKLSQRYVRSALPSSTDIKTYDVGSLIVATEGQSGGATISELHVEYDVELMTPTQNPLSILSGKLLSGGTVSQNNPLGTAPVLLGSSFQGAVITNVSSKNQVVFAQIGSYLFFFSKIGGTLVNTVITTISAPDGVAPSLSNINHVINSTATIADELYVLSITEPGQGIIIDCTGDASISISSMRLASYVYSYA